MKNLKNLGTILNKQQQKEINGGFGLCEGQGAFGDFCLDDGDCQCLAFDFLSPAACFGNVCGPA